MSEGNVIQQFAYGLVDTPYSVLITIISVAEDLTAALIKLPTKSLSMLDDKTDDFSIQGLLPLWTLF